MKVGLFVSLIRAVSSCGMSTHIQVSHLAMGYLEGYENLDPALPLSRYYELLKRNKRALQAGSYFPDWGYACRKYEDAGEEAHWPPFYESAVKHMRNTYPQEIEKFLVLGGNATFPMTRNEQAFEALVAFLFGAVSHGVSDVAWHGQDGRDQGFIPSLAQQDWEGDFFKAHKVADPGGDLVLAHATSLDYFKTIWDIPVKDILAIYKDLGYNKVRWWDFRRCMALGLAAAQFTRFSGSGLFGKFGTDQSPFLVQNYLTYFHGGLYNMASLVRYCWEDLMASIEGHLKGEFCTMQFPDSSRAQKSIAHNPEISDIMPPQVTPKASCKKLSDVLEITGTYPHGQFGTASEVGRFYGDDRRQLAISAPYAHTPIFSKNGTNHLGKVIIYDDITLEKIQELNSPGSWVNEARFGASLLSLDVNGDGIDDLLVGAPSYSIPGKAYRGRVWIYFGKRGEGLSKQPSSFLDAPHKGGFLGFGMVMRAAKLDGKLDLIVGSPYALEQSGMICGGLPRLSSKKLKWCVTPPDSKPYDHFGTSIAISTTSNHTWMFVGAPGSSGKVYAFDPSFQTLPRVLATGAPGARFGASLALLGSSPLQLAIGAPSENSGSRWQAGIIYQLELSLKSNHRIQPLLTGEGSASGLGSALIAHPSFGLLASEPLSNWEAGRIHSLFPDQPPNCLTLQNPIFKSQFGSSLTLANVDGTTFLIVGQTHYSDPNMP